MIELTILGRNDYKMSKTSFRSCIGDLHVKKKIMAFLILSKSDFFLLLLWLTRVIFSLYPMFQKFPKQNGIFNVSSENSDKYISAEYFYVCSSFFLPLLLHFFVLFKFHNLIAQFTFLMDEMPFSKYSPLYIIFIIVNVLNALNLRSSTFLFKY